MRWVVTPVVLAILVWRVARRRRGPRRLTGGSRSDVVLVAAREYRERARSRTFKISTAVVLLVLLAAIVGPGIGRHRHGAPLRVAVDSAAPPWVGASVVALAHALDQAVTVTTAPASVARAALGAGTVDVTASARELRVAGSAAANGAAQSYVHALALTLGRLRAATAAGLSPSQSAAVIGAPALPVHGLPVSPAGSTYVAVLVIGAIIAFVLLTQYATWTLLGVMEEKSSRVVEVLLATMRPLRLLSGKVLGIGALALTQVALLGAVALIAARATGTSVLAGSSLSSVAVWAVWILLGYGVASWVYAAAGSLAERQDQVQGLLLPLNVPTIVGYVTALTAASAGHASTLLRVLAFIPLTSTFAVPTLIGLHAMSGGAALVSALESVVAIVLVARGAAAIYQRAILRGGRVRLRDLRAAR
ncbi:MAG: ABC transporter permease [Acidimicrobiales bacterium]